jgi:hypothetical protein
VRTQSFIAASVPTEACGIVNVKFIAFKCKDQLARIQGNMLKKLNYKRSIFKPRLGTFMPMLSPLNFLPPINIML